jgi:hypothetical protein
MPFKNSISGPLQVYLRAGAAGGAGGLLQGRRHRAHHPSQGRHEPRRQGMGIGPIGKKHPFFVKFVDLRWNSWTRI